MATGKKGSSAPAGEQKQKKPAYEVHIDMPFDDPGKSLRAVASMTIGDFAVHGIKLFQNENGTFVSMPAIPYKDANGETKYNDIFHPITAEARGNSANSLLQPTIRNSQPNRPRSRQKLPHRPCSRCNLPSSNKKSKEKERGIPV